jgi:hypothetical protein
MDINQLVGAASADIRSLTFEKEPKLEATDIPSVNTLRAAQRGSHFDNTGVPLEHQTPHATAALFHPDLQVFLINHRWNEIMGSVAEMKLPYSNMVMEFTVSGRRIAAVCWEHPIEKLPKITLYIQARNGVWLTVGQRHVITAELAAFKSQCFHLVFASLAALDAEAATTDFHQAPKFTNEKRIKKGKLPLPAYHVVVVNKNRKRHDSTNEEYQGVVRLHWRRGHWRQYESGPRVWVKSHLVGNPDLGFIDKHYRV